MREREQRKQCQLLMVEDTCRRDEDDYVEEDVRVGQQASACVGGTHVERARGGLELDVREGSIEFEFVTLRNSSWASDLT
jgi:hypothetical protein